MLIAVANTALASNVGRGGLYAPKHVNKAILLGRIYRLLCLLATDAPVNCCVEAVEKIRIYYNITIFLLIDELSISSEFILSFITVSLREV
jgi:hypothetical protein